MTDEEFYKKLEEHRGGEISNLLYNGNIIIDLF